MFLNMFYWDLSCFRNLQHLSVRPHCEGLSLPSDWKSSLLPYISVPFKLMQSISPRLAEFQNLSELKRN